MDMFPWRKAVQECKPILVFFKEDCTIDEIVFSFVPLNPLATISRCAVLVAGLTQVFAKCEYTVPALMILHRRETHKGDFRTNGEPSIKALPQRAKAEAPQDGFGLDLKATSRNSSQPRGSIAPYSSLNLRQVRGAENRH